jgi:DNA-binding response OmpR family regulator
MMVGSGKILIIDDDPDFLFTMATFLKRSGFETLTAQDGQEGLDLAQRERPDLVLLDVMMETLFSGFEVCKRLKSDVNLKSIPIIGISGMGDQLGVKFDKEKDGEYFSPDEFLEKPLDKVRLLEKIKRLLSQ